MKYKKISAFIIIIIIIGLLLLIAFYFRLILAPFIFAYMLHLALRPFVNMLEQKDIKHSAAVSIVFISTFLIITVFSIIIFPAIASELFNIQDNSEEYSKVLTKKYDTLRSKFFGSSGPLGIIMVNENIRGEINTYLKNKLSFLIEKITQSIFSILPMFFYVVVIPFATFFFLLDGHRIKKKIIGLVPNRYFEITLNILHSLHSGLRLGGFVNDLRLPTLQSAKDGFGPSLRPLDFPFPQRPFASHNKEALRRYNLLAPKSM